MKTLKYWRESKTGNFNNYVKQYDEVDYDIYWHFLQCLPPIYKEGGFMCSEPVDVNEQGDTIYGAFYCTGDDSDVDSKYYFLGDIAISDWGEHVTKMKVKRGLLKEVYAHRNTSSSKGIPTQYFINPFDIVLINVWFNVNGNPSYGFIMSNGDTYLLIDDYGAMNGVNHLSRRKVSRKKDLV